MPGPATRGPEVADIFRAHGAAYLAAHRPSGTQRKAFAAITACRTAALGGHLDVCADCDASRPSYNSCRNRHCPKCQSLAQARWIAARKERVLPVHHFHVVFTLPGSLRPLARRNAARIYDLLFAAASSTLLTLGQDPDRLGGLLGVTGVLHSWTRELTFHPHLHCIVTGGGLSPDGTRWLATRRKHLFPVRVLGALFRGKFMDGLITAHRERPFDLPSDLEDPRDFTAWKDHLYREDWVVYAKQPFGGAEQVFAYLGRYTHRVGLSNQRIRAADDHGVTFVTKGDKTVTLEPVEFIRRFLLHVLPHRFVKIRHYGLLASGNVDGKLALARHLLDAPAASAPSSADVVLGGWQALFHRLTGIDPTRCVRCGGLLTRHPLARRLDSS